MTLELWIHGMAAIGSVVAAVTGIVALVRIRDVHMTLNSRLTEMLKVTRSEGHLQGEKQERESRREGT